jgi:hypothetical protein
MLRWAVVAAVAVCGCGDDTHVFLDASVARDLAVVIDLGPPDLTPPAPDLAGIPCGAETCGNGTICCIAGGTSTSCAASCDDGGIAVSCAGPGDCTDNSVYCCATLSVGPGTPPACPLLAGTTSCTNSCSTQLPAGCPGDGQIKLCKGAQDCSLDPVDKNCCVFSYMGKTIAACVSDQYKSLAMSCYQ